MTIWSPQQDAALVAVAKWLADPEAPQVFRIFGFAGCGKTTLARHFGEGVEGQVLYGAYTGKAAYVLRQKGCPGASTIHSMIYQSKGLSREKLRDLERSLVELRGELTVEFRDSGSPVDSPEGGEPVFTIEQEVDNHPRVLDIIGMIRKERDILSRPMFTLNSDSVVKDAKLVIIDECFVGSTLVDTPFGSRRIDDIKIGDLVFNASGIDSVVNIKRRKESQIAKIQCGGTLFYCSRSHPFYTDEGIKSAGQLKPGNNLLRTVEAMRLLRNSVHSQECLGALLWSELQHQLGNEYSGIENKNLQRKARTKCRYWSKKMARFRSSKSRGGKKEGRGNEALYTSRGSSKDQQNTEGSWTQADDTWWKWTIDANPSKTLIGTIRKWLGSRIYCANGSTSQRRLTHTLQNRYCTSDQDDIDRGGWKFPLFKENSKSGSEEGKISSFSRVDSVEILEQGHLELDQFRDSNESLYLYDLEVEQHPSFSVYGHLVHNCSMIDGRMGEDVTSFGTKILVLGDPAQLPPIMGAGYFTEGVTPDVMLTDIHRQAKDNPIIAMATKVRNHESLSVGSYGESLVAEKCHIDETHALAADQILVGRNKTRHASNKRMRALYGRTDHLPVSEDKLVCLRNNHEIGLLNGAIWFVNEMGLIEDDRLFMTIRSENSDDEVLEVEAHTQYFMGQGEALPWWERKNAEEFDFGYALTVHKAQGSQWDNVLLFDESHCFRADKHRWLYTGLTRAAERVVVVKM